jgi:hypothetical protein
MATFNPAAQSKKKPGSQDESGSNRRRRELPLQLLQSQPSVQPPLQLGDGCNVSKRRDRFNKNVGLLLVFGG